MTQYLIEQRRRFPQASGELNALILDVSIACKAIARQVALGALAEAPTAGTVNIQGEAQKPLDVISNEMLIRQTEWSGHLAGMASEEMEAPYQIPQPYTRGKYLLVFDPLDGSSNLDVNVSVGSIFSILRAPPDVIDSGRNRVGFRVVEIDALDADLVLEARQVFRLAGRGEHAPAAGLHRLRCREPDPGRTACDEDGALRHAAALKPRRRSVPRSRSSSRRRSQPKADRG